jgi:hypothetical protein
LLVGNSANGFRDLLAIIDLSTYRRLPWEENIPFFLVNFVVPETQKLLEVKSQAENSNGWKLIAGLELEVREHGVNAELNGSTFSLLKLRTQSQRRDSNVYGP